MSGLGGGQRGQKIVLANSVGGSGLFCAGCAAGLMFFVLIFVDNIVTSTLSAYAGQARTLYTSAGQRQSLSVDWANSSFAIGPPDGNNYATTTWNSDITSGMTAIQVGVSMHGARLDVKLFRAMSICAQSPVLELFAFDFRSMPPDAMVLMVTVQITRVAPASVSSLNLHLAARFTIASHLTTASKSEFSERWRFLHVYDQ